MNVCDRKYFFCNSSQMCNVFLLIHFVNKVQCMYVSVTVNKGIIKFLAKKKNLSKIHYQVQCCQINCSLNCYLELELY